MNSNRVNEFLPPAANSDRMDTGNPPESEGDIAQYLHVLKTEKLEELKRLEDDHHQKQVQLDQQVQANNQQLFAQYQHKYRELNGSIQQAHENLRHIQEIAQQSLKDLEESVAASIDSQVDLRLQQQRLHDEHVASTTAAEDQYRHKLTHWIDRQSATRATNHYGHAGRESLTPKLFNAPLGSSRGSPAIQTESARNSVPPAVHAPQDAPAERRIHHEPVAQPPTATQHVPRGPSPRQQIPATPEPLPERPLPQQSNAQYHQAAEPVGPESAPAPRRAERSRGSMYPVDQSQGEPVPKPVPETTPGAQHGQANDTPENVKDAKVSEPPKDPIGTPRQEAKRKAAESPATSTGTSTKRARTRDKPPEPEAHENAARTPPKRESRPRGSPNTPSAAQPAVQRTISFNEVFQDGKAQYKHQIIEYKSGSGNWYIVKCDEHDVHFKYGNPVHGAAKHVASPQHGNKDKTHDLAIKLLGVLVTECNAELAEMNNREFRRAIDEDGYEVHNRNLLSKSGKLRADERRRHPHPSKEGGEIHVNGNNASKQSKRQKLKAPALGTVLEPKECHFYQGLWSSTKKMYCLIVLPIRPDGSLHEVGLREKFQEIPLINNAPKCYRVDRVSLQIKGWQPAYEDGGPKVNKREYPVMYFDKIPPSLGWLHAQKLVELDLDNPPAGMVDTKGLKKARQWFAEKMNHRRNWEEYKVLGRGEPPSATPNGDGGWGNQGSFLRSANKQDEDSPRRGRFRGAETVDDTDKSSGADSDDEDPMKMDIGPIPDPEAGDSNYIDGSGSEAEGSVGETQEADTQHSALDQEHDETRPTSRGSSGRGRDVEMDLGGPVESRDEVDSAASKQGPSPRDPSPRDTPRNPSHEPHTDKQPDGPAPQVQESNHSSILSPREDMRHGVQEKAAEIVREAASRSRTSSEVPASVDDGLKARAPVERDSITPQRQPQERQEDQTRPHDQKRPEGLVRPDIQRAESWDDRRSRSDDTTKSVLAAPAVGKLNEGRKPSNIENLLNPAGEGTRAESNENFDSYKRFDALKAQMESEQPVRPASVPVQPNVQQFQPPPAHTTKAGGEVPRQGSGSASHSPSPRAAWPSPPAQPAAMGPPRSAFSPPAPGPVRSTSASAVPDAAQRWKAVRTPSYEAKSPVARASFINTAPAAPAPAPVPVPAPAPAPAPAPGPVHMPGPIRANSNGTPAPATPQPVVSTPGATTTPNPILAETPTSGAEKEVIFDVCHFHDQGRGVRWSRDNPGASYLRLVADSARGVARSAGSEGFKAAIEPDRVARVDAETDAAKGVQQVRLYLRDGSEQVVVFDTNSAGGRKIQAKIQGRRFTSWVRRCNPRVEYHEWIKPAFAA